MKEARYYGYGFNYIYSHVGNVFLAGLVMKEEQYYGCCFNYISSREGNVFLGIAP